METDSLWQGEPDAELKRSIRHIYARVSFSQFIDGKINEKRFLSSLQKLLSIPEPKTQQHRGGKNLFNSKDRELIGELLQSTALPRSKNKKRGRGNVATSSLLVHRATSLATFLLNERPFALRKDVELRVYQLMAIDRGEFIQSQRTIQIWLAPFFLSRSKDRAKKHI